MAQLGPTARILHDEHEETLGRLQRLEGLIRQHLSVPPPEGDVAVDAVLTDLVTGLSHALDSHFRFEEEQLFPRLEATDDGIGEHFSEEHVAIRAVAQPLMDMARAALSEGFSEADWNRFRRLALELCERLVSHIEKEDLALPPMIEEALEADEDARLANAYRA